MTLVMFLESYGGNACISIKKGNHQYCEEEKWDYLLIPTDYYGDPDETLLSDDNPNHYKPSCLEKDEDWFQEIKDCEIKHWNIIGGGIYPVELTIELENE